MKIPPLTPKGGQEILVFIILIKNDMIEMNIIDVTNFNSPLGARGHEF